jgi:hypothetical protein
MAAQETAGVNRPSRAGDASSHDDEPRYWSGPLADQKNVTLAANVQVYFCGPRSPWQRGSNENTNGSLRRYFPKGTDLSGYSQSYLNKIAPRLSQRSSKT